MSRLRDILSRALARSPKKALAPVDNRGGWWPIVREFTAGAWQANVDVSVTDALSYWAQFRCISLIANDIAKCRLKLVQQDSDGIWSETEAAAFSPVIRKPNHFQNRIQFYTNWMESKLSRGNAYVLKIRDDRQVVKALFILDPLRTHPLVAEDGSVFYQVKSDRLAALDADIAIPASEIIHDRWNTLFHPLVGLSPIYANGIIALAGSRITNNSARFFGNGARPSGVLTAPNEIADSTAKRLREYWEKNFSGENAGKVAVLGDGLKFEQMTMSAVDAQLIDQLKWDDATIAGSYGVPAYMINAGTAPAYNNVEALGQQYYSQCLQIHFESIELCLDEGLGLAEGGKGYGTEFDLDDLLRMDTATQFKTMADAVKGILTTDEARGKLGYGKTPGGNVVLTQQQNYSLEAISKRDAKDDPFASSGNSGVTSPSAADGNDNDNEEPTEDDMAAAGSVAARSLKSHFARLSA